MNRNLREFIKEVDQRKQLRRIKTLVDPELEIAEISNRLLQAGGPALLFENVKGYDMPVLGNAFGSMKRLELSLETSDFTEI